MQNRREFLKSAALTVGAASMAVNPVKVLAERSDKAITYAGHLPGSNMVGFVAPKLEKVRVGVIGIGGRGSSAVTRLSHVPGVVVTGLCELIQEKADRAAAGLKEAGFPKPKIFVGPDAYKKMCDSGVCDVVHINTNWESHAELAIYAMKAGIHTLVEVPGCRTIDQAWEMIETCEKSKVHCMMLENCCYGDDEMLMLNVSRLRLLDELYHAEACYIHETRAPYPQGGQGFLSEDTIFSSLEVLINHTGMLYPMHALGPVSLALDINRGDRFHHLVSMGNKGFGWQEVAKRKYGADAPVSRVKFLANDFNTTVISTENGKTILLRQCNNCPGEYCREYALYGFNGQLRANPLKAGIEESLGAGASWKDEEQLAAFREEYRHDLWKKEGEVARNQGGHGGMDYMMDFRWSYCLRNGLPLDMTVYDLAAWSCIIPLSEQSVLGGSVPVDIPDFTRGQWRQNAPVGEWITDIDKI